MERAKEILQGLERDELSRGGRGSFQHRGDVAERHGEQQKNEREKSRARYARSQHGDDRRLVRGLARRDLVHDRVRRKSALR